MKRRVWEQRQEQAAQNAEKSKRPGHIQGWETVRARLDSPGRKLLAIAFLFFLLLLFFRFARFVLARRWTSAGHAGDRDDAGAEQPVPIPARRATAGRMGTKNGSQPARTRPRQKHKAPSQGRRWRKPGRWLMLLEVLAVIFVLVTGTGAWVSLQDLNETYRSLQRAGPQLLPTLGAAANPDLAAVARVHPGAPEAPVDLLPAAGAMAAPALPTPPPTITPASPAAPAEGETVAALEPTPVPDYARHIQIPAIDVDSPVFPSEEPLALKLGVAQFGYVTEPGQPGNLVLAAHNDSYGEIFRHLEDLEQGDEVTLFGKHSSYRYRVREKRIVNPDDVWVTLPTPRSTITLITCYPYLIDTHRLVVFAELEQ